MPRIPELLLDSVIYLYPDAQSAAEGTREGGSGFLVHVVSSHERGPSSVYAVTNSHVVRAHQGNAPVVRLTAADGSIATLPLTEDQWVHHSDGDDVAVCPLGLKPEFYKYSSLAADHWLLDRDEIDEFGPGPGEDVFFLGRFVSHEGTHKNLPTVRFGNIAMMPWEPVRLPTSGILQECFLVEARSLSGYSGSPVFFYAMPYSPPWGSMKELNTDHHTHEPLSSTAEIGLLGIDFMHFQDRQPVRDPADNNKPVPERWWVEQNSGIMGVVPAWKLAELLNTKELIEMRAKQQREWLDDEARSADVTLDTEARQTSEFDQFKDLTRKLVNVPKTEIDEKRKES